MKIKYSPDASGKLRHIRKYAGQKRISKITKSIRGLVGTPHKGSAVESMLGSILFFACGTSLYILQSRKRHHFYFGYLQ